MILSAVLLIITLVSSAYIVREAEHDCLGDRCPVCTTLHQAEHILTQSGTATAGSAPVQASCIFFALALVVFAAQTELCDTLISQKIRLNN